ncbi:LCP family protein [Streptomyces sp. H10-C2]|uniref:LCP family protein n=1 Tax=unclassified Streptomyces TaxID=2593676 RepID=UPI0024BB6A25|nr:MULTISPECIES: LCP family protein [unclassified Streptomyces]MDJ0346121.1 LCP family protein [Streptomyces sp. PH10-H1]MDJ0371617.1 LCP family protein [Streptomyces sp. H10-C2]
MSGSHKAGAGRGGEDRAAPGRRRQRSPLRIAAAIAVAILVLLIAGAGWIYIQLNGNINTFDADGVSKDRPKAATAGQNVLVIGSDSRAGDNSSLGGGKGDVGRSDTAFLLHVYADSKHAVGVSIPRDSLVDIPPCKLPDGTWTKPQSNAMFNSAFSVGNTAQGNPACSQNTVEKLTGLRVDHTVVVDFAGFSRMTSAVGGVQVCLPKDVYQGDLNPNRGSRGKLLFAKGQQTVSGQQALDYVRLRHGIGDGSDIGRIQRQQAFVSSLIKKVKGQGFSPTTLLPLANAATKSMTVDPGLGSADKLLSFAMSMKDIDLHNTKFITLPWRYQGARVAIVHPDADTLWAALRADRTLDGKDASGTSGGKASPGASAGSTAPAPDSGKGINVAVYNGTTVKGLAGRAADTLKAGGFTVTSTATAGSQDHATTVIKYGRGKQDQARTVARLFPGAELKTTTAPGISVTLGQDYATAPSPSTPTPTALAAGIADKARSADDDPCSNLSYG